MLQVHRIRWIEPYFDLVLNEIPYESRNILDVGAGSGILGFIIKKTRDVMLEGIEPFDYDLKHFDYIHRMTWQEFVKSRAGIKYDVVVSTEMIEHMEKWDAKEFLEQAKAYGRKVIICTPYKFDQQPAYDGNELQVHRCLVTDKDFKKAGYAVYYIGGSTFPPKNKLTRRMHKLKPDISKTPINQTRKFSKSKFMTKPTNIMAIWTE